MPLPRVYTVFHLNLAFSSIEKENRPEVIRHCYWPLLQLAESGVPVGIEATGYTLRAIAALDPDWIAALKRLIAAGAVEFIGSGYSQMIAPLVPPEVTRWNLRLGLMDYDEILGIRPKAAMVNEQAYGPGLVPLYLEAGFEAIIMDWSEPSSHNKKWQHSYAHRPQMLAGAGGSSIAVIWSDAMSFQKFQRYAHGEIDAEEYLEFLSLQLGGSGRAFPLYTSDAEIFDYRPGRFSSEAAQNQKGTEFKRIKHLFNLLQKKPDELRLVLPSAALELVDRSRPPVRMETPAAPVPVKKQRKYNLSRWAVTGRNDLHLNTHCWRMFDRLQESKDPSTEQWRMLCDYWASDFRTHITEKRWKEMLASLPPARRSMQKPAMAPSSGGKAAVISRKGRFLVINTANSHLVLNCQRGLAVQSFGFGVAEAEQAGAPAQNGLVGTVAHGFYQDIAMGADFYSGHFIHEPASSHKVTDLLPVDPAIQNNGDGQGVKVSAEIPTAFGLVKKTIWLHPAGDSFTVTLDGVPLPLAGTMRVAHLTLNPRAFDQRTLYYQAHNGGELPDKHQLWDAGLVVMDHGAAVSRLVSATTGLGMTGDMLELGDKAHYVRLQVKRTDAAGIGMLTCKPVDDTYFVRAAVSMQEVDETAGRAHYTPTDTMTPLVLAATISIGKHEDGHTA